MILSRTPTRCDPIREPRRSHRETARRNKDCGVSWTMSGGCQLTRDRVHGCGCRHRVWARRGVRWQMCTWQARGAGAVCRMEASGFRERRFAAVCGPGSACHAQRVTFGEDALPVDRDPCHPIRTASPGCYDHAIHLKLSRGSSSIHTRAHELKILNIPKLPAESRRGAPVAGWREHGSVQQHPLVPRTLLPLRLLSPLI